MTGESQDGVDALARSLARIPGELPRMRAELAELLAIDTSLPPGGNYPALVDRIASWLAPLGFDCRRIVVPESLWRSEALGFAGERVNLLATMKQADGAARPPLFIYAHLDTVPPGDGWTVPPFALSERDGRLIGRGAADMKGTIPCLLAALRIAEDCGVRLRFAPAFLGCTDEEGGTYPGIRYLADEGLIDGLILNLNGGAVPRIWAGCFGSIDVHIKVGGRSGHSGQFGATVNAIDAALPVMNALRELARRVSSRASQVLPAPPGHDGPLRARLSIGVVRGGVKASQVPGECVLIVNRRYAPEEDFGAVVEEIRAAVAGAIAETPMASATVTLGGHLPPVVDPDGPSWPRWVKAMAAGFGWPAASFARYGAVSSSDMGWLGRREILLGGLAGPAANAHGADESTCNEHLAGLTRSLLLFLAEDFEPRG
jgi:succinyl-diaminopimelate desuccinylase